MTPSWLGRCALPCAAAFAATLPPATRVLALAPPVVAPGVVSPAVVAGGGPARPDARPKLKWDRVCDLSLGEGRINLHCDLTLDLMRELDRSPISVAGLPGTTTLEVTPPRLYLARNTRRVGNAEVEVTVLSSRGSLTLRMDRTADGRTVRVLYSQTSSDYGRRTSGRSDQSQLTVTGGPGDNVLIGAGDFTTLRKEHPHEVNRYLRPLLRQIGADDLLRIEAAAARQVLLVADDGGPGDGVTTGGDTKGAVDAKAGGESKPATGPAIRPAEAARPPTSHPDADRGKMDAAVRDLLAELNAPTFARRQAAADRLAALGPPAVAALGRVDRRRLSAQQIQEVDLLASAATPLSPDEARLMRADAHFLIDCLYSPDARIRAVAADRLRQVAKATGDQLAPVLAVGQEGDPERLIPAVEDLRDVLMPKAK